jgi:branched-chain amino acid transport system ATP-binding protein
MAPQDIARLGIARSFQLMNLFDEFTVFENIAVALPATRQRGGNVIFSAYADSAVVDETQEILSRIGLADRANDDAKSLPYGSRRSLEIGIALACRPKLLFLDEPTAGLGSDGRRRLAELISNLKGQLTIVVIEHDMEFLFSLADNISVIHWGQVIARGTPVELKENPWVASSNLGRLN